MVIKKNMGETYKCEECGLVVGIKGTSKKAPTAELTCCGRTMTKK